jgi:tetratricopeptide (TPR) repeat protein
MSKKRKDRWQQAHPPGAKGYEASPKSSADPNVARSTRSRAKGGRRLRALLAMLLIVVVVATVYANAWPNRLVHDDKYFVGSDRFATLSNVPRYFVENTWAASAADRGLYRPLFLVSTTLDARVHGNWYAGYHLTNIALHALVAILVFGFLLQLLRMTHAESRANAPAALLLALLFAAHPVNTEVVNSVFNRSDMLVAIFGLAGLNWFLRHLESRPVSAWIGLAVAYLLALFCKESAIVLPGLAVVLVLVTMPGTIKAKLRKSLPVLCLLLPLAFYLGLRAHALAPPEVVEVSASGSAVMTDVAGTPGASPVEAMRDRFEVPGWRRLSQVSGLWFESFSILLWPHPLSVMHGGVSNFARVAGLMLHLALLSAALYQFRRKRYGLFTGLAFFYIAMLPASRIIGDPDVMPHLAERYLYFPSVGLAVVLAFGLRFLAQRFDVLLLASAVLAATILLTSITWARNEVWATEVKLFESEYSNGNYNRWILVWLTAAHIQDSNWRRVAEICDRHARERNLSAVISSHCGVGYGKLGRSDDAEAVFLAAISKKAGLAMAHVNLASFYLEQERWEDARKHFEMAVEAEKLPVSRAWRKGNMLVRLYPSDREKLLEAKALFEEALELQPSHGPARRWLAWVNQALGTP